LPNISTHAATLLKGRLQLVHSALIKFSLASYTRNLSYHKADRAMHTEKMLRTLGVDNTCATHGGDAL